MLSDAIIVFYDVKIPFSIISVLPGASLILQNTLATSLKLTAPQLHFNDKLAL